ncbi:phosphatidate cytidylyltransferase [Salinihabitans flavidus]|uniref:Phosphatidate cytidylyltransferase n=1 Tax=Salinihabitans flavidus TaxID=569882 RepID=A0A1H8NFI6_9RHOB|nr:phosphatidate cytidylyltransferase [Salinihabitans flavidus]SEO28163.1 phosphatidate cytidylyltransferase [Salinihabitans flavidus]
MSDGGKWGDLPARVGSAVVMVTIGAVALWLGGLWFRLLCALICGGMLWELTRILAPEKSALAVQMGILGTGVLLIATYGIGLLTLPVLIAPVLVGATQISRERAIFAGYSALLLLACFGLAALRDFRGVDWVVWLVAVVIASDVAGYFAGRMLGGPKVWPRVSPKKTWSGTVAGWIGAALVGWALLGPGVVVLSVLTAIAAQMGDIAESAIKRRSGVKDSSALIPGHGGLMDRFDAMMGAALFVLLVGVTTGLPGVG